MRYTKPTNLYKPKVNRPDKVEVPDDTIMILTETDSFDAVADDLIVPLRDNKKRDWFNQHFYFCLPLTIGNQYGFMVKSLVDILLRWDGDESPNGLVVETSAEKGQHTRQIISSHFGCGIVTIQNRWTYRTPKGVNLYVTQPPNFPMHGLHFMSAVIECDNLRRDFTFNIKVTQPQTDIFIPKGSPIGCFLPYPRHFVDNYKMQHHPKGDVLDAERATMNEHGRIRNSSGGAPDMCYMKGEDAYGNKFDDHQRGLDRGPYHKKLPS